MTRRSLTLALAFLGSTFTLACVAYAAPSSLFDLPVLKLENLPSGGQSLSLSLQTLILMSALTI